MKMQNKSLVLGDTKNNWEQRHMISYMMSTEKIKINSGSSNLCIATLLCFKSLVL